MAAVNHTMLALSLRRELYAGPIPQRNQCPAFPIGCIYIGLYRVVYIGLYRVVYIGLYIPYRLYIGCIQLWGDSWPRCM